MGSSNRIIKGLFWKVLERFGVQGINFILQIVLARILDPAHYGVLSLMIIFTTLANVFIQNGFNTALIQNKDVTEEDYSSVFWVTAAAALLIYAGLFAAAPVIARFYEMPDLIAPFRVLCLILLPGALNSIQLAIVSRKMDFKKVFYSNIGAIATAGIAGIVLAYAGAGLWALVAQNLVNVFIACAVMWSTVKWRPRRVCNFSRVKALFSFGWKLLVSSLLDTLYQDIRSLVIGKKYAADMLGYYNRGKQFPQFFITSVNSAVQSVLLPAMSSEQDDKAQVKMLVRHSITLSSFIIFPLMAGLAGAAAPVVRLLLTDKWLPCVPFMQIYCFSLAFYPVHTGNLQAINAVGRSDIFLKLELIKKGIGMIALVIAVFCFDSPIAIAMTGVFTTFISCFVNAFPNKKLIDYSYGEQMRDILPALLISLAMCGCVLLVGMLKLPAFALLMLQIVTGVLVYAGASMAFKVPAFGMLLGMAKKMLKKKTA